MTRLKVRATAPLGPRRSARPVTALRRPRSRVTHPGGLSQPVAVCSYSWSYETWRPRQSLSASTWLRRRWAAAPGVPWKYWSGMCSSPERPVHDLPSPVETEVRIHQLAGLPRSDPRGPGRTSADRDRGFRAVRPLPAHQHRRAPRIPGRRPTPGGVLEPPAVEPRVEPAAERPGVTPAGCSGRGTPRRGGGLERHTDVRFETVALDDVLAAATAVVRSKASSSGPRRPPLHHRGPESPWQTHRPPRSRPCPQKLIAPLSPLRLVARPPSPVSVPPGAPRAPAVRATRGLSWRPFAGPLSCRNGFYTAAPPVYNGPPPRPRA